MDFVRCFNSKCLQSGKVLLELLSEVFAVAHLIINKMNYDTFVQQNREMLDCYANGMNPFAYKHLSQVE